jgi:hypothetical protein
MMIKMNWSYWALLAVSWLLMTVVLADQSEASLTVDAGIRVRPLLCRSIHICVIIHRLFGSRKNRSNFKNK